MRGCFDTVTIWHRTRAPRAPDIWNRSVIPVSCKFISTLRITSSENGAVKANVYAVIVPFYDGFEADEFCVGQAKFCVGDIAALGEWDLDQSMGFSDILKAISGRGFEIMSVQDNTRNPNGQHWRLEG